MCGSNLARRSIVSFPAPTIFDIFFHLGQKKVSVTRKHCISLFHTGNNDEKLAINLLTAFVSLFILNAYFEYSRLRTGLEQKNPSNSLYTYLLNRRLVGSTDQADSSGL